MRPTDLPTLEGYDDLGPYWECADCLTRHRSRAAWAVCCRFDAA